MNNQKVINGKWLLDTFEYLNIAFYILIFLKGLVWECRNDDNIKRIKRASRTGKALFILTASPLEARHNTPCDKAP